VTDAVDLAAADAEARRALVEERLGLVRELVARRSAPGALLWLRRTFAWLSVGGLNHVVGGSETGAVPLLVTPSQAVAVSPNIERARILDEELRGLPIEVVPVPWWEPDAIGAEAERRAGGRPIGDADLETDLVPLRSRLSPLERARMIEIGRATRAGLEAALGTLEGGQTEWQLAAALEGALAGYRVPVLLVAADERIERYRHPLPTALRIRQRVMLVVVAERWGLHVAATRFRELEPPSADLAARIEATLAVEAAMHGATRAGTTFGDVFAAAQHAYAEAGVPDEWRLHHQGGTIGYQGRERIAVPGDPTRIEPGMGFAWNPSITGAKAEETFVLELDGTRTTVTR
jgi:Xaa-Pro aminopeptidase